MENLKSIIELRGNKSGNCDIILNHEVVGCLSNQEAVEIFQKLIEIRDSDLIDKLVDKLVEFSEIEDDVEELSESLCEVSEAYHSREEIPDVLSIAVCEMLPNTYVINELEAFVYELKKILYNLSYIKDSE